MNHSRVAYFDTIGGIAGNMALGALVNAGMPLEYLKRELQKIDLRGYEIEAKHVQRSGITALAIEVIVSGGDKDHRHFNQIKELIEGSSLPEEVKRNAINIFTTLAEAEARIHGTSVEKIHFHEVGAVDSIVDIVGTAIGLQFHEIQRVFSSPVKMGSNTTVKSAHGIIPIPAPATLEILRGYPVMLTAMPHELTTPTGAAIIKTLSRGILTDEQFVITSIGYGAGTREFDKLPNLLRVAIGSLAEPAAEDEIIVIEANIDDMNPEIYPYVIEKLLDSGARDVFLTPLIMKKGRPGTQISVLTTAQDFNAMVNILHSETTSIGVRYHRAQRKTLPRESRIIETEFGKVRVKSVEISGQVYTKPELEDCKRIADELNIPLREVYRRLSTL